MNRLPACVRRGSALALALLAACAAGAEPVRLPPSFVSRFVARPLGPANMGGRVTDVAVVENRPTTMYVASASGGLWKTVNYGTTWQPVFEREATISLGAVAIAPTDPNIVWVGTGEANARNSVSWGDGVYRSLDGGKSWKNCGLRDTKHIGRIVIHPRDPKIVYVAALGHVWAANKERGLFKTTDGGKTWKHVLALDADTGCIDAALDPSDPETLYAAAYRVRRNAFSGPNPIEQFGPRAGLYRSRDGGKTWTRLTKGLPKRPLGRCGLAVWRKDPRIVYAVVQTDRTDISGIPGQAAATSDEPETGGVFRSTDRGETWTKLNDLCPRPFYFSQIRIDPRDQRRIYVLGIPLFVSDDGGKTFRDNGARGGVHGDHHALWIDPANPDHLVLGNDGGLYLSYDRGANWENLQNLPIAQYYAIGVDQRKPYHIYGGLQDSGSWGGPSRTHRHEGITLADWVRINGGDGFYCQVDPTNPNTVYAEAQYGTLSRLNLRTGQDLSIWPRRPSKQTPRYRFNWCAPLLISAHDPRTLYFGGNHLFKSTDRGDHWKALGPDLTRGKPGGRSFQGHTITTIAQSPLKASLLYVGTDDGNVMVTRDEGGEWIDASDRVPGVPEARHVSRVECSPFDEGTAYLAIDRHRNDDRAPYLFRATDYGHHWKPLVNDLPKEGSIHVVRADPRNRNLLYVGTEFGLFASLDGGRHWQRLGGLPTVAVHDLVIHPSARELVIATHGRGLYVLDVAPLQEMTAAVLAEPAHLFDVKPAPQFDYHGSTWLTGGKRFVAANPPYGADIYFCLKEKASGKVSLTVLNSAGKELAHLPAGSAAGLHRVHWDLRWRVGWKGDRDEEPPQAAPGTYNVRLQVGDKVLLKKLRIETEE
jgi:photosystem II stability/assembly factor-like uncharacterized protein